MTTPLEIRGPDVPGQDRVLTPDAIGFLEPLLRRFAPQRDRLLARRRDVQQRLRAGGLPDFLTETADIREAEWTVAPSPADLTDRRVEITGPVERKMMINALNSGARVFMADFEDALSPPWTNVITGQVNCMDAVRRTLEYRSPEGKRYVLGDRLATLVVRPRGWHLEEKHILLQGRPDRAAGERQRVLGRVEDVVPEPGLEMALQLGEVEVGAAPSRPELARVMEEVECEVHQARRHRPSLQQNVLLLQMPTPRPHDERGQAIAEDIA
ncbi:MAG TPA: hypothetical protein VF061_06285, partial [Gemmatimonadales bacterium]